MGLHSGQAAQLPRARRQLAAGRVTAPILDVADDSGALAGLEGFDPAVLSGVALSSWGMLVFFAATGVGFAALFPRHGTRGRTVFLALAAAPLVAYWTLGGLRLSTAVSILLLALGIVSWRIAGDEAHEVR